MIHSLSDSAFVEISILLKAIMVKNGAFSHKLDYNTIFSKILNLQVQPNCITGSRVTAILLNGWILAVGGASAVEGLPHLV